MGPQGAGLPFRGRGSGKFEKFFWGCCTGEGNGGGAGGEEWKGFWKEGLG